MFTIEKGGNKGWIMFKSSRREDVIGTQLLKDNGEKPDITKKLNKIWPSLGRQKDTKPTIAKQQG